MRNIKARLSPTASASKLHKSTRLPQELHLIQHCIRSGRRSFHTTHFVSESTISTPYEVLGLTPSASQADIKKQFYHLSKTHHPDRNPHNQEEASRKFVTISDAYRILGDPVKREKFDHEQQRQAVGSSYGTAASGSYTAGARKASGLSRRRTHFRGPPPSFYRNGAWGAQAKKGAGFDTDSHDTDAPGRPYQHQQQQQQQANGGGYAGTTGSWPFNTDPNDVPHFDREGHFRTTSSLEEQLQKGRARRRRAFHEAEDDRIAEDTPANILGRFFMVGAALLVGVGAPVLMFAGSPRGGIG